MLKLVQWRHDSVNCLATDPVTSLRAVCTALGNQVVATAPRCPVCGNGSFARVPSPHEWGLRRCSTCGLRSLSTHPTPAWYSAHYARDYYAQRVPHGVKLRAKVALDSTTNDWIKAVRPLLTMGWLPRPPYPGAPLLDVGCGAGATLVRARQLGWVAEGTELSDASAEAVRKAGFRCYTDWSDLEALSERYQHVVFNHVLEHLPEPADALASLRGACRQGASMVIGLPNFGSLQAQAFGAAWWANLPPDHIWYFEPRHLKRLLEAAGFRIVGLRQQPVIKGVLSPAVVRTQLSLAVSSGADRRAALCAYASSLGRSLVHGVRGRLDAVLLYAFECRAI